MAADLVLLTQRLTVSLRRGAVPATAVKASFRPPHPGNRMDKREGRHILMEPRTAAATAATVQGGIDTLLDKVAARSKYLTDEHRRRLRALADSGAAPKATGRKGAAA